MKTQRRTKQQQLDAINFDNRIGAFIYISELMDLHEALCLCRMTQAHIHAAISRLSKMQSLTENNQATRYKIAYLRARIKQ